MRHPACGRYPRTGVMSMTTETTADTDAVGLGRGGRMSRQRRRDAVLRLLRGCAVKAALSSGCKPHPANSLQPEAIGAVMEATKWLKPSISVSRSGDSASGQAATRVTAEQASKRTMCRPTRHPYRGRLIRLGSKSEGYPHPLHRGRGGGMSTRKAHATREALWRGQGCPTGGP